MKVHVIMKWDGNVWVLEGNGFVMEQLAAEYCKGSDALKYKGITVDVNCERSHRRCTDYRADGNRKEYYHTKA